MSDFVSPFWGYYVAVLVVGSFAFLIWVLASNMTKKETGQVELHGHIWDESLQEWNNPLPRWWLYLFWLTIAFGMAYLVFYPGFGTFAGKIGWTSHAQYDAEKAIADKHFNDKFARFESMDVKAISADPEAREMGKRLFLTYCQQCHGSDARGAKGFPNLTDNDWLWGGEPDRIVETITQGRQAGMPTWAALGAESIKDVANYVRSLSGLAHDSLRAQRGKDVFAQNCVACHGPEGKGNHAVGAPNLTDKIWLYGSSEATIIETVTKGRSGRMPTFGPLLGDKKIKLLAAYVYGLSANTAAAQ
jgi:cytochrome c oxidase cbb3-type subunit 3